MCLIQMSKNNTHTHTHTQKYEHKQFKYTYFGMPIIELIAAPVCCRIEQRHL